MIRIARGGEPKKLATLRNAKMAALSSLGREPTSDDIVDTERSQRSCGLLSITSAAIASRGCRKASMMLSTIDPSAELIGNRDARLLMAIGGLPFRGITCCSHAPHAIVPGKMTCFH